MSGPVDTLRDALENYRAILNSGVNRRADYLTEDDMPAYASLAAVEALVDAAQQVGRVEQQAMSASLGMARSNARRDLARALQPFLSGEEKQERQET